MEKKKFLYDNLPYIENNKRLIISNYIKNNEIEFTENNNGILLNISNLENKHVDYLYDLCNMVEQENISYEIKVEIINKDKKKPVKSIKDYNCSPLEELILAYS
jgi:hypothetical protein